MSINPDYDGFVDNGYLVLYDLENLTPVLDLNSSATNAPVLLPQSVIDADMVVLSFSVTTAVNVLDIQIVIYDTRAKITVATIPGTSAVPPNPRNQTGEAGTAGLENQVPIQFDIRGTPRTSNHRLYIVLTGASDVSSGEAAHLLMIQMVSGRPL